MHRERRIGGKISRRGAAKMPRETKRDPYHRNDNTLTDKQKELLPYIARGMTSKEIAHELNISASSVDSRIEKMKDATGCLTREELIEYAKNEEQA